MVLLKYLKTKQGINIRYTNCDHAGESKDLERVCKQEELGTSLNHIMQDKL